MKKKNILQKTCLYRIKKEKKATTLKNNSVVHPYWVWLEQN